MAGSILHITDDHPVWIESEGAWIDMAAVREGMTVLLLDGSVAVIDAIELLPDPVVVYNFGVEGLENYFVGPDAVLVHNCPARIEGIYEFFHVVSKKWYVGQSGNIAARVAQHGANVAPGTLRITAVRGGWLQRRIAEQRRINEMIGQGHQLANRINSIAARYWQRHGIRAPRRNDTGGLAGRSG